MPEKQEKANPGEDALKQKYAELRVAASQIKQLQQQLEAVEEKKRELEAASSSLEELKSAREGTKMLAPITDGIFAKATIENCDELIVNVGSNVCVKKTVDEARRMMEGKKHELAAFQESLLEELTGLTGHADALEAELGKMLQEE